MAVMAAKTQEKAISTPISIWTLALFALFLSELLDARAASGSNLFGLITSDAPTKVAVGDPHVAVSRVNRQSVSHAQAVTASLLSASKSKTLRKREDRLSWYASCYGCGGAGSAYKDFLPGSLPLPKETSKSLPWREPELRHNGTVSSSLWYVRPLDPQLC